MSKAMPKRITITLPNPVYDALTQLADVRDEPVASLATEAVKEMVRTAKEIGEISPDKDLKDSQ